MLSKIRFDIYTILIVAMVPTFLVIAWGLTWNHDRIAAKHACENTDTYLTEVSAIADLYTSAGTLQNANTWYDQLEQISPPGPARDLHNSVSSAVTYSMNRNPDLQTSQPAGLYDALPPFQQPVDKGRDKIIERCPELTPLIPDAFPMFFQKGDR